jgi:DNA-binding response OmpR family regulator
MTTILLIEDDRNCARMVAKILEPHGYTIHHAANGLTGLRMAREHKPDIILVDMDLPDLEGKVVVLQLRGGITPSHVPIVAFTAEPGAKAKRLALAVGCKEFISKPIDTRAFPDQIGRILNNEKLAV